MLLRTLLLPQILLVGVACSQTFHGLAKLRGSYEVTGTFEQRGDFAPASSPTSLPVQLDKGEPSLTAWNVTGMTGPLTLQLSRQVAGEFGKVKTLTARVSIHPIRLDVSKIGPMSLTVDVDGRYLIKGAAGAGMAVVRGTYSVSDGSETVRGTFDLDLGMRGSLWNRLNARSYPDSLVLEDESPLGFHIPAQTVFSTTIGEQPVTLSLGAQLSSAPALRLVSGVAKAEPVAKVSVAGGNPLAFSIQNANPGTDWMTVQVRTKIRLIRRGSRDVKRHRARKVRVQIGLQGRSVAGRDVLLSLSSLPPGAAEILEISPASGTFRGNRYRVSSTVTVSSEVHWGTSVTFPGKSIVRGRR